MLSLTRAMLPAFALAAMMSVAQAQTAADQNRDGAATMTQVQPGMMMNMDQMGGMMPMMRQMMMGQQGGMGMPFEHAEGRIAFLKTELRITDSQTPQWNAFADTLRANAKAHQAMHEQMAKGAMPSSWPERLAFQQKAMSTRLDGLKELEGAAKPLYAVLTDDQKKLADQLLPGPMGMM